MARSQITESATPVVCYALPKWQYADTIDRITRSLFYAVSEHVDLEGRNVSVDLPEFDIMRKRVAGILYDVFTATDDPQTMFIAGLIGGENDVVRDVTHSRSGRLLK